MKLPVTNVLELPHRHGFDATVEKNAIGVANIRRAAIEFRTLRNDASMYHLYACLT